MSLTFSLSSLLFFVPCAQAQPTLKSESAKKSTQARSPSPSTQKVSASSDSSAQARTKSEETSDKKDDLSSDEASPTSPMASRSSTSAVKPETTSEQEIEPVVKQKKSLARALTLIARDAARGLRPDVRNGLIRIAVPTFQGQGGDQSLREALSAALAQRLSELPNIFVTNTATTIDAMRRLERADLTLTAGRPISLGQHLGARYLVIARVEPSSTPDEVVLSAQVIGVKQRGIIAQRSQILENGIAVSRSDLNAFRSASVFDESRLGAVWRSAVVPGWGQLYQGHHGQAIGYFALTLGLIAAGTWSHLRGVDAANIYQKNTENTVSYRWEANQHFDRARLIWGALGVTWATSVISAFFQGEDRAHVQLNFDPSRGGLSLSGAF